MGASYFDQGKFEEAIAAYLNATTYDQNNAVGWYYIGTIYEKIGQNIKAIDAFEKAISIDPNLTVVQSRLETVKKNITSSVGDQEKESFNTTGNTSSELFSGLLNILK